MSCPTNTQVVAMMAGDAALAARHAFEDHVDECDACRALMVGLVKDSFAWKPGARVGRYVIGERIGQGAMGAVYKAEDIELARPVAIKRLHAQDARAHAKLLREARSAAQLQHPNTIAVYEVIEDPPCLAMEMVEGVTLTAWLADNKRPWREVVAMVAQAGRGLHAAHARGLIHGDFKPDNVLIDGDGRARVADFGLANVEPSGVTDSGVKLARATATGAGTPAYMAPELVDGELPSAKSDLYAFAITMYEALHGQHPFAGATAEAVWAEMALGNIRPGRRGVPAWLDRRVRRGLACDPDARWPDVAAFVDAIEARPQWPKWVALGGAAAAIAGVAVALGGGPVHVDDCSPGLVDELWNGSVRDAQRAKFLSVRPIDGVAIDAAGRDVDAFADAWKHGRRAACTVGEPERAARVACLDRQLDGLRAQLGVWASPDADTVDNASRAAALLGRPADCAAAPAVDMLDPGVNARIAEVHALVHSGHSLAAKPQLEPMIAAATATGHPRDLALALLAAANAERDMNGLAAAKEHYARAAQEAGRAHDDTTMLDATLLEAGTQAELGHARDSLGLVDVAAAIDARTQQHRVSDIAFVRGEILVSLGDGPGALAALLPIVPDQEVRAKTDPQVRKDLSGLYAMIAGALSSLDRRTAAREILQHVVELDEQFLGPEHPEVGKSLHDLAQMEMQLDDLASAQVHLAHAQKILRAAYGEHNVLVGFSYATEAKIAVMQGRFDDARAGNERALATVTGLLPDDHPVFAAIESDLGEILRNTNKCREAIPHFRHVVYLLGKSGHDPKSHATALTDLAACLTDVGASDEAKRTFEQSIQELVDGHFEKRWQSEPYAGLADLAFAAGDKPGAIAYEQKAIAMLDGETGQDVVAMLSYERDQLALFHK